MPPVISPAEPTAGHRYDCRLRWGDMDAQGHLNNASYLDYLQEARVDFLLSGPSVLRDLLTTGVLVVSHQVEYLRPVEYSMDPLHIRLWVDALGGSRFAIGYDVFAAGELAARARTGAVPFDLAGNRLRRLTSDERTLFAAALAPAEPLRPVPRGRVGERAHRFALFVRWSDLDSYGHVNNVKYFDYVQEARIALMNEALEWGPDDVWVIVRQDLEYRRPIDFRTEPYEVASTVSDLGNRSFRLEVEIRDPASGDVFASARTVVVGDSPLTDTARTALARWSG
jgi:acyl-CoA thioester hydrolase